MVDINTTQKSELLIKRVSFIKAQCKAVMFTVLVYPLTVHV